MAIDWPTLYAERTHRVTGSAIRELLKCTQRPEIISFAGGMPAPELFPLERIREAADRILSDPATGQAGLQYGLTEGYRPLRELIVATAARAGLAAQLENVLITTGSQQALDLIARLLLNPGDKVLVEAPTFPGALQAFDACEAQYAGVPVDAQGAQTNSFRMFTAVQSQPKFMYLQPNFQNPAGGTQTAERRQTVVEIADDYGIPVVEDDPYTQLRYEGEPVPSIFGLDQERHARRADEGHVFYLGTFSKTLAPGLRLGWVIAPAEVIAGLVRLKQGVDLHTSTFVQQLVYDVARDGFLDEHIRQLREVYRERRDVMLAALEANMPAEATWSRPAGGLFVWLHLPSGVDSASLLKQAMARNVAFVPGSAFFARPLEGERYCRLNFSNMRPERIMEGIGRLGALLKQQLAHPGRLAPTVAAN